jgi:hypothetical protein
MTVTKETKSERRTPQSINVEGAPLTTRNIPRHQDRIKSRKPLPSAKFYKIKLMYGTSYSGPGEFTSPALNTVLLEKKAAFVKALTDQKIFSIDEIQAMSEKNFPVKKARRRWVFQNGETKETNDVKLAEIYQKKMCVYSRNIVDENGVHRREISRGDSSTDRVNRFQVIPVDVFVEGEDE